MRAPPVKTIRRVMIGVIVLTLIALLGNYLQTWYRRSRQVKTALQILAPEMKRSASDVEYSEYRGNPRVLRFKIHAGLLLETKEGKSLLEGIEAWDFNPDGSIRNEIRSRTAEYDADRKIADFFGDVRLRINGKMELQMDSLHYDLNTDVGSTPDRMRFSSELVRGSARGIRFEQRQQSLRLDSDVDLTLIRTLRPGVAGAAPSSLRATAKRAFCSELDSYVLLEGNARIDSDMENLSGDRIEAAMDPAEKRLRSLTATGNAVYSSRGTGDEQILAGGQIVFDIGWAGTLDRIHLSGQARFSSKSAADAQELKGEVIDVDFDAKQLPSKIQAREAVSFQMKREKEQILFSGQQLDAAFVAETKYIQNILVRGRPERKEQAGMSVELADSEGSRLQANEIRLNLREAGGRAQLETMRAEGSARYVSVPPRGTGGKSVPARSVSASLLEMTMSGTGQSFESGSATGEVVISEEPDAPAGRPQMKRMSADRARFRFFPSGNALRDLDAEGRVLIEYRKQPSGNARGPEQFRTSSEHMNAVFALEAGKSVVRSVAQWGGFAYEDGIRRASSDRCDYDAGKSLLLLTGSPRILDPGKSTAGDRVEYDQGSQVLSVFGRVRSVLSSSGAKGSFFGSAASSQGIVMSDQMRYWTETGKVLYSGSVRVLSEDQELRTDALEISDGLEQVSARGSVRHMLKAKKNASSPGGEGPKEVSAGDQSTTVQSSEMAYSRAENRVQYTGKVKLRSREMDLASDALDAELDSGGQSIRQATARGSVVMQTGERVCKGDVAHYDGDSKKVVVTGNPVEVLDPAKGRSTARRLTSSTSDDTILLEQ